MPRSSRGSDNGNEEWGVQKKRRLLYDINIAEESLKQVGKTNNYSNVMDGNSDSRLLASEGSNFSSRSSEVSNSIRRSTLGLEYNSSSSRITSGSGLFCNSDIDTDIIDSFRTRPRYRKQDLVFQDDFKTALSRESSFAQDPSFGLGLESNKSSSFADISINGNSDNFKENENFTRKGNRFKYRRINHDRWTNKEKNEFENALNDITTNECQSKIDYSPPNYHVNEVTNDGLDEVSNFTSNNETRYGAPSAMTYCRQVVTGQVAGVSYITISEVKDRVIIPGRSCPRPRKRGIEEGTFAESVTELAYNNNAEVDYRNSLVKTTHSQVTNMRVYKDDVGEPFDAQNFECLSDSYSVTENITDELNRSGPRVQDCSPGFDRSRPSKYREQRLAISDDIYGELLGDDILSESDVKNLSMNTFEDTNNTHVRSHKVNRYQKSARLSIGSDETDLNYRGSLNRVAERSRSRRSLLKEISKTEFENISLESDTSQTGDSNGPSWKVFVSNSSDEQDLNKLERVKEAHDYVTKKKVEKNPSAEVKKMTNTFKNHLSESHIESEANVTDDLDSVPMERKRRRNRIKTREKNAFELAMGEYSLSDVANSISSTVEEYSFSKKKISVPENELPKAAVNSKDSLRESITTVASENTKQFYEKMMKQLSKSRMEPDETMVEEEDSLKIDVKKPKKKRNAVKPVRGDEFNLVLEDDSLSKTADSISSAAETFNQSEKAQKPSAPQNENVPVDSKNTSSETFSDDALINRRPLSAERNSNLSKSRLELDANIVEDADSLKMDVKKRKKKRNSFNPVRGDEFNFILEDDSLSKTADSISSAAEASNQSEKAQKPSAPQNEKVSVDSKNTSRETFTDVALINRKSLSEERKGNFSKSRLVLDADSLQMDVKKPKKKRNAVKPVKGDEFNLVLEDDSLSKTADSISSAAEAINQSEKAQKPSAPQNENVSVNSKNTSRETFTGDALINRIPLSAERKSNLSKRRLELDANIVEEEDSLKINVNKPRMKRHPVKPVRSDAFNLVLEDDSLSKTADSISSAAEAINQSEKAQKPSAPQNEKVSVDSKNTSRETFTGDALINRIPLSAERKSNLSKSRLELDANIVEEADSLKINLNKPRMKRHPVKPVRSDAFNLVLEDDSLPKTADSITSAAEASNQSEKDQKPSAPQNEKVSVDSKNTSRETFTGDALINRIPLSEERESNLSKSRLELDANIVEEADSLKINLNKPRMKRHPVKPVRSDAFNLVLEDDSLSKTADSISSAAEAFNQSEKARKPSAPQNENVAVDSKNTSRETSTDDALINRKPLSAERKSNLSKSRLELDANIVEEADSLKINLNKPRMKRHLVKPVRSDAFNLVLEDDSLSKTADSISSAAEAFNQSEKAQKPSAPQNENVSVNSKNTSRETFTGDALINRIPLSEERESNLSKSRLELDANIVEEADSLKINLNKPRMKRHPVKPVRCDAFNLVLEDDSLSKTADSISSAAEAIYQSEKAQKPSAPQNEKVSVDSKNTSRETFTDVALINKKSLSEERKGNFSKSRLVLDADSLQMDVKKPKKKRNAVKPVKGDEFNLVLEDDSLSKTADSISSAAEAINQSEKAQKPSAPQNEKVSVDSKNTSRETFTGDALINRIPLSEERESNFSKSRLELDANIVEEADSLKMDVKKRKKKKNSFNPVRVDEFNFILEDDSLSKTADSISSAAEAINQSEKAQKPSVLENENVAVDSKNTSRETSDSITSAVKVSDCLPKLEMDSVAVCVMSENDNESIQCLNEEVAKQDSQQVVMKMIDNFNQSQFQSEANHANESFSHLIHNSEKLIQRTSASPQIECSMDKSLSNSKISNYVGYDIAESTRHFVGIKDTPNELIMDYFGDVSGITGNAVTDKAGSINNVASTHAISKRSLNLHINKSDNLEFSNEPDDLRCKSGGDNLTVEGFLKFSLEKKTSDLHKSFKSDSHTSNPRNISDLVRCDVDLDISASLSNEDKIIAIDLSDKCELEMVGFLTEDPSKIKFSDAYKSKVDNSEGKVKASNRADHSPEKIDTTVKMPSDVNSHQASIHNKSSEKLTNSLAAVDDLRIIKSNANLPVDTQIFPKQSGDSKTDTDQSSATPVKEVTIVEIQHTVQPLVPQKISKLPVPCKPNRRTAYDSKSSYSSNAKSFLPPPALVLQKENETLEKLDNLISINEQTFPVKRVSPSPENIENLADNIPRGIGEPSHLKCTPSEIQSTAYVASKGLDNENHNGAEKGEVPVVKDTNTEKSNLPESSISKCLETPVIASTNINELTFIKTSAPGMTSTPLLSSLSKNKMYTEEVSMLSGISELTFDRSAAHESLFNSFEHSELLGNGRAEVIDPSPAISELTFVKSNLCPLPRIPEQASEVFCGSKQTKGTVADKEMVLLTFDVPSLQTADGKSNAVVENPSVINDLRPSFLVSSSSCSPESEIEKVKENTSCIVEEQTFIISAAPVTQFPSEVVFVKDIVNADISLLSSFKPANEISFVKSGDQIAHEIQDGVSEKLGDDAAEFEPGDVPSAINEIDPIVSEVPLNTAEGNVPNNVAVFSTNATSIVQVLEGQTSTNQINPSEKIAKIDDFKKPVIPETACTGTPGSTFIISKPATPKPIKPSNATSAQSKSYDSAVDSELLLLSPLDITDDFKKPVIPETACTETPGGTFIISNPATPKPIKPSNATSAQSKSYDSAVDSELLLLSPLNIDILNAVRRKSDSASTLLSSRLGESEKLLDKGNDSERSSNTRISELSSVGEYEVSHERYKKPLGINFSGPTGARKREISHLRLSAVSGISFLRPSTFREVDLSSVTLGSAKESDADSTRPSRLSSHNSAGSSMEKSEETLATPLKKSYKYFSTPTPAEERAVMEVIEAIDASARKRKQQRFAALERIFPKVIPENRQFKKPCIPYKPKMAEDEDLEEKNRPLKKRRLPVWVRNLGLKRVVTEVIEEQEECLTDAQDFLFDLVDIVKIVTKSKRAREVREGVEKVKQKLFSLNLIRTLRDFYQFVRDHLPLEFRRRSIPCSGNVEFNPIWEMEADLDRSLFPSSD